jgi:hypothetical protein
MDPTTFRRTLFELIGEVRSRAVVGWLNLDPQDEKGGLVVEPWLCWRWFCETYPEQQVTIPEFRRLLRVCSEHDQELLRDRIYAPADRVDWVQKFTGPSSPWPNARLGVDPERWKLSDVVLVDVWYCPDCRRARTEAEREGFTGWEQATNPEELFSGGPPSVHGEKLKRLLAEHRRRVSRTDPIDPRLAASLYERFNARPEVQRAKREAHERQEQLLGEMEIRRIATPSFAPRYAQGEVTFEGVSKDGMTLIRSRREHVLGRLREAVERSLRRICKIEEDSFPYLGCMTGEYYLEKERYEWAPDGPWAYRADLPVRCLGRRGGEVGDYCGLDIVLRFSADLKDCEEYYSGHQVI